jgi:transmembrane sensor
MSRDRRSRLNAQISDEAAEWFVEFRTAEMNATARQQFDAWVRSSPEHLRAYLEIAAIWNESDALTTRNPLQLEHATARSAKVIDLPSSLNAASPPAEAFRQVRRKRSRRTAIAAGVGALLVSALGILGYQVTRPTEYATQVGEQRSVRLDDGSTVELNSRSRIRVRFSASERHIELLSGQALFQVAKDRTRSFIVRSDEAQVKAVGTQFDVNRKRHATIVTVIEGQVAVSGPSAAGAGTRSKTSARASALLLKAGEQVTLLPHTAPRRVRTNASAVTAWTQNQLVFESARLADVAEEFNQYSTRPLIVEDHARPELRLSGVFTTDPDFLIRYLREQPDITVRETRAEIRIIRRDRNAL